ncbi:MAG: bifunctional riboflavin kinase/FAD synthetase [Bacteroidota bacterium]
MQVHHSIKSFAKKTYTTILTIGVFDGVHIGHQKVIETLNTNKADSSSALFTFFPHPRRVLNANNDLRMLTTIEEKIQLLEKFGLDILIIEPFTDEFSDLPPRDFVKNLLVEKLHVKKLVIGYDHRFGKDRKGDFDQLQRFSKEFGFEVEEISAQEMEDVAVSSTKIRKALEEGEIEKANKYLGYNYLLTGKVVTGIGLGRKINFPTINISIDDEQKLIPKNGVYIVRTKINQNNVFGIMNIGFRPTVDGKHKTIEVHLLDFNGNLYDEELQIEILKRLREEQKFESVEALTLQIKKDEEKARDWIITEKFLK